MLTFSFANIVNISTFKNMLPQTEQHVADTPLLVNQNGKPSFVVMNAMDFEKMNAMADLGVASKLQQMMEKVRSEYQLGLSNDNEDFLDELE